MGALPGGPAVAPRVSLHGRASRAPSALLVMAGVLLGCEQPEEPEPPSIETAYLLDRVDGVVPPAPICEDGAVRTLRFESIALADDGSYGRLQETQAGGNPPIRQEERGQYERATDAILLRNAAGDAITLALLDSAGDFARRVHPCGDTLRYESVAVAE